MVTKNTNMWKIPEIDIRLCNEIAFNARRLSGSVKESLYPLISNLRE